MNLNWLKTEKAWQPFTFRGSARFADSSLGRLLFWQTFMALVSAGILVWFLDRCWFPVMDQAVANLPEAGSIRNGTLVGPVEALSLAENRFVAITLDMVHAGKARGPAHIQVEAGASGLRIFSLFGFVDWPYPKEPINIEVGRSVLEPWWGAWRTPLLWIAFLGTFIGLIATWWALSLLYFVPVWVLGCCAGRELKLFGSWKLCGAALLPGALCMAIGMALYSLAGIGLVELLAIQAAHWVVGIVYCCGAVMRRPLPATNAPGINPFGTEPEESAPKQGSKPLNPFRSSGK